MVIFRIKYNLRKETTQSNIYQKEGIYFEIGINGFSSKGISCCATAGV